MATSDRSFLEAVRSLRCLSCGKAGSEAHHIKSRGAGGGDDFWNVIPLCTGCHTMNAYGEAWHRGREVFLERKPHVMKHLEKLGWRRLGGKLIHFPDLITF